jgi:hypothetical protein
MKFKVRINTVFDKINDCFQANLLSLNFDKTKFVQFLTKNSHELYKWAMKISRLPVLIILNFWDWVWFVPCLGRIILMN